MSRLSLYISYVGSKVRIVSLTNINLIDFIEKLEGPIGIVKCSTDLDCALLEICTIKKLCCI